MSLIGLLWVADAWARAGGGQNFGGSSSGGGFPSSGGGSWSVGGGGGGGGGELPPELIIPIALIIVILSIRNASRSGGSGGGDRTVARTGTAPPSVALGGLLARDPGFSPTLFLDHARLVYTTAWEHADRLDTLGGLLRPEARAVLAAKATGPVRDVIIGAARLNRVSLDAAGVHLRVYLETNLTLGGAQLLQNEMWSFIRTNREPSPPPERLRELRCGQCGSALAARPDGACANCGAALDDTTLPWVVEHILVVESRPVPALSLTPGGGPEVGVDLPTPVSPTLKDDLTRLVARHADVDWATLRPKLVQIFTKIQESWSSMQWSGARPYETDFLYRQHRYWIERYRRDGLVNRMADLRVTDVRPVKVALDRDVSVLTVRIYATMLDWTERRDGHVVGGSKTQPRSFSEYWTFVRGATSRGGGDALHCPSCGAPLDQVGETGVCGHCDTCITTGDFDWVLSAIDQDESYRG